MNRRTKIVSLYLFVAVASVAMVAFFFRLGASVPEGELPVMSDVGAEETETFFAIEEDLELVKQDGEAVMLSEIRGEVTVVAQFFAVCPHCAVRNGIELQEIYRKFGDHPDFWIVCITVDPETDHQEQLEDYAEALGADAKNWWFATAGEQAKTHDYLERVLKFFGIRERRDPVDIASHGRFAHDLGFLLVDRDFNVVGKWPLADARSDDARQRDPHLYERLKAEMYERIEQELNGDERGTNGVADAAGE